MHPPVGGALQRACHPNVQAKRGLPMARIDGRCQERGVATLTSSVACTQPSVVQMAASGGMVSAWKMGHRVALPRRAEAKCAPVEGSRSRRRLMCTSAVSHAAVTSTAARERTAPTRRLPDLLVGGRRRLELPKWAGRKRGRKPTARGDQGGPPRTNRGRFTHFPEKSVP